MDKSRWGLLQARVEVFQGSIWATWDKTAPDFHEYLGEADMYLATGLLHTDGSDNGAEVLGGVVKWRLGCNWKVPCPDTDTTHGWITHRSTALALGRRRNGQPGAPARRPLDLRGADAEPLHRLVPGGSHDGRDDPRRGRPRLGRVRHWNDRPAVREYLREKFELRKKRLGLMAHLSVGPAIFPNEAGSGASSASCTPRAPP